MDISFSCICPVIDNKFRHNIVKVVCRSTWLSSLWIHSYFDNVMIKFMINNRTDARKTDVNLLTFGFYTFFTTFVYFWTLCQAHSTYSPPGGAK